MLSGMIISSKLKSSHLPTVNIRNKHRKEHKLVLKCITGGLTIISVLEFRGNWVGFCSLLLFVPSSNSLDAKIINLH